MKRVVGGVRKSERQSWLVKGWGLLCLGFKGVQKDFQSKEASTLQIGSMAFPPGHQSTTPSLPQTIWPKCQSRQVFRLPIVQTLLPVTFGYSLSSEALVMRQLTRWKRLWWRSLTRSHKRTSMGPSRICYTECIAAGGDFFEGDYSLMCVLSINVPIRKMYWNLFNDPRIIFPSVNVDLIKLFKIGEWK